MLQITFTDSVYQPEDEVIPGNASSPTPVKFHLKPPLAPDLARLKSIVYAVTGLANPSDWTPGMQVAVLKAFETGRDAFDHTVRKVEGLYVPAVAALRCGAITPNLIPKRIDPMAAAGTLVSMLAHTAAHQYGFEFWGIRTAKLRDSMARQVSWTVTGIVPAD